ERELQFGHGKDVSVLISNAAKISGSAIVAPASAGIPRGARSQIGRDAFHAVEYLSRARRELRNTPPQELCGFKVARLRGFSRRGVRWRYSERSGKSCSPI